MAASSSSSSSSSRLVHEQISEQLYEHGIMKPGAYLAEDLLTVFQNRIGEMRLLFDVWGGPQAEQALARIRDITSRDRHDITIRRTQCVNPEEIGELVESIDRAWFGGQLRRRLYLWPRGSLYSSENCFYKVRLVSVPVSLLSSKEELYGTIEYETKFWSYKYPLRWQRRAMITKSLITAMVTLYFEIFCCRCTECQDPARLMHTMGLSGHGKFWSTAVSLIHKSFKSEMGLDFPYDIGKETSLQSVLSRGLRKEIDSRLERMERQNFLKQIEQEKKSIADARSSSKS